MCRATGGCCGHTRSTRSLHPARENERRRASPPLADSARKSSLRNRRARAHCTVTSSGSRGFSQAGIIWPRHPRHLSPSLFLLSFLRFLYSEHVFFFFYRTSVFLIPHRSRSRGFSRARGARHEVIRRVVTSGPPDGFDVFTPRRNFRALCAHLRAIRRTSTTRTAVRRSLAAESPSPLQLLAAHCIREWSGF